MTTYAYSKGDLEINRIYWSKPVLHTKNPVNTRDLMGTVHQVLY